MHLFTLFLLYLGNLDADVTHTGQDFSFHIMSDGYVYGIALMHLIDVDREVILIVADTLSSAHAVLSISWQFTVSILHSPGIFLFR